MTALSWEHWVVALPGARLQGHRAAAGRAWTATWTTLRSDTSGFDDLGVDEILEHYEGIIGELDAPPIIMGHSFGGAFTQILLDRGLGAAGVAIDSAPLKGMFALPGSTLKAGRPILKSPANRHKAVALTPEEFHYSFTNTLTEEESGPDLRALRRARARAGSCSRARWPTSTRTPAWPWTSRTTTARRCC